MPHVLSSSGSYPGRGVLAATGALALVLLLVLWAGRSGLAGWGAEPGAADARPGPAVVAATVEADIVVVRDGRVRAYSSRQLAPHGRLVFARFAADRARGGARAPVGIAEWIFRVVPDADEIRITVRDPASSSTVREAPYEYHRESFVTS